MSESGVAGFGALRDVERDLPLAAERSEGRRANDLLEGFQDALYERLVGKLDACVPFEQVFHEHGWGGG